MNDETPKDATNGHIEVDSYSVTVGHARVQMEREGRTWRIFSTAQRSRYVYFPDDGKSSHETMTSVAVEFARRLDEARRAQDIAARHEEAVYAWFSEQVYRGAN